MVEIRRRRCLLCALLCWSERGAKKGQPGHPTTIVNDSSAASGKNAKTLHYCTGQIATLQVELVLFVNRIETAGQPEATRERFFDALVVLQ